MVPKYLMDDKHLNFNQPLLSVRRGSSTALPEVDRKKTTRASPSIPPLPYYKSELKSGPVRNPGVIPFQWEQTPGRPKDESKLQIKAAEQSPAAPRLPPGRVTNKDESPSDKPSKEPDGSKSHLEYDGTSVSDSSSMYKNAGEFERSEGVREENGSSMSEGETSTYVDALDTLSRSESFFLNCSVTGVIGLDDPSMKPSGTFIDPLARDFMMGRFLPAAKAVASESPHFGIKKQHVAKEQPREVKKVIKSDNQPSRYCYTPMSLPQHPQVEEEEEDTEEEDDDNEDDFGRTEKVSVKLCGLLPRFCLLNPVTGMRDQVPRPISLVSKIHKKPGNSSTFNKTDKAIRDAVYEKRRLAVYQRSDMRIEGGHLKYELDKLNPLNDSLKFVKSLKCSSSEKTNIAPYKSVSCHSLMQKERGFLGIPEAANDSKASKPSSQRKVYTRFPEVLADETAAKEPLANRTVEKTLYIDSAQMTECRHSNSSSYESRSMTDSRGRTPSIDYSLHDIKDLCCADNMTASQSGDFNLPSSQEMLNQELQTQKTNGVHQVQDHRQDSSNQLPNADVQQLLMKDNNEENTMDRNPVLPLPLPKSPSESWLSRTLPSVSSKNAKSYVSTGSPGFRASPVDPKWEAVVRSSKLHNKNFVHPALTTISEN